MFSELKPKRAYAEIGLIALVVCIVTNIVLILLDGLLRGHGNASGGVGYVLLIWITDFRYFFEQGVYASTVFFVGAKFIETRTVLSIGFDRLDASRISLKGPDENNIVWIGRRYATPLEAQTVSEVFAERLKQSAV